MLCTQAVPAQKSWKAQRQLDLRGIPAVAMKEKPPTSLFPSVTNLKAIIDSDAFIVPGEFIPQCLVFPFPSNLTAIKQI